MTNLTIQSNSHAHLIICKIVAWLLSNAYITGRTMVTIILLMITYCFNGLIMTGLLVVASYNSRSVISYSVSYSTSTAAWCCWLLTPGPLLLFIIYHSCYQRATTTTTWLKLVPKRIDKNSSVANTTTHGVFAPSAKKSLNIMM